MLTCTTIERVAYKYVRKYKIIQKEVSEIHNQELRIKNKVYITLLHVNNKKRKLTALVTNVQY